MRYYVVGHRSTKEQIFLTGPFDTEAEALDSKPKAIHRICDELPESWFWTFSLAKTESIIPTKWGKDGT